MLVNHDHKFVVITPPKCGGSSIQTSLWHNSIVVHGYQAGVEYGTHTSRLPYAVRNHMDDYTIYILTRHPYLRMLSLYGHYQREKHEPPITFDTFVKHRALPFSITFFATPMSFWIKEFELLYPGTPWKELPLDYSKDILAKEQNYHFDLVHVNKSSHPPEHTAYTTELVQLVNYWGTHDFNILGYEPVPWWSVREAK